MFGQASFSTDGTSYAFWGGRNFFKPGHIRLYDFNRCTGELYNERSDTLTSAFGAGLSFSPNGKLLYISNDDYIYQYEVDAPDFPSSRQEVAEWDQWKDDWNIGHTLGYMALGQDNKIYVIPNAGGSRYMHLIQQPNERGEACKVQQHVLHLPKNISSGRTVPNYPNFRLGPLDGSACDTLGIDNNPVARFSFEQDSLDYRTLYFTDLSYYEPEIWEWNFGDGGTSLEVNPVYEFGSDGVFEVCLRVNNEYSTDTKCVQINIGSVGLDNSFTSIEISLFPNPVQDKLLVRFTDFLLRNGSIVFYDTQGKLILTERIYYGLNSLDVSGLRAGIYFYQVFDEAFVLGSGKVVKVE